MIERINIIQALSALKDGKKVSRNVWISKERAYLKICKTSSGEAYIALFENEVESVENQSFHLSFVEINELISNNEPWRVVEDEN